MKNLSIYPLVSRMLMSAGALAGYGRRCLGGKMLAVRTLMCTGCLRRRFASFGARSVIRPRPDVLLGAQYISIGSDVVIGSGITLTAWTLPDRPSQHPQISIGDGSSIGAYSHITAIDRIVIGRNVLTGRNVLITDNSHGALLPGEGDIPPVERPLHSKGAVIIEDNVWIGEKASIMPGVTVGRGAVVAANAVVTHDVPPNTLVAGVPAKVIRKI